MRHPLIKLAKNGIDRLTLAGGQITDEGWNTSRDLTYEIENLGRHAVVVTVVQIGAMFRATARNTHTHKRVQKVDANASEALYDATMEAI